MEARTLKLVWLVPSLILSLLPAADAASRGSPSSHSSSGHFHGRQVRKRFRQDLHRK